MDKRWYKSKTIVAGIIVFIGGGFVAIGLPEFGNPIMAIGTALGFVGLRTAMK